MQPFCSVNLPRDDEREINLLLVSYLIMERIESTGGFLTYVFHFAIAISGHDDDSLRVVFFSNNTPDGCINYKPLLKHSAHLKQHGGEWLRIKDEQLGGRALAANRTECMENKYPYGTERYIMYKERV